MVHNFGEREETVEVEVVVPDGLPVMQHFKITPNQLQNYPLLYPSILQ